MKQILIAFIFTSVLMSCNSSDKTKNVTVPSSEIDEITTSAPDENETQFIPIATDEALIATALMAAPEASRSGCKVIGYNMAGDFVTLREGNNEFIVLVDNTEKVGFNAACYHKDLEPFMARGRALKAEGKTGQEVFAIREEEMKSGKFEIPTGATLHIYYGAKTNYDPKTSKVDGAQMRYVVYMPWATAESTGLPEVPIAANHPWIMNPGTHRAHIMISPLPDETN